MKLRANAAEGSGQGSKLRVRKSVPRKRVARSSVLKMLGAMDKATPDKTASASDQVDDFLTSGRTGRRNALHDIMGEHAATSVADLPACLDKLSTHDASTSGASGSGASNPFGRTDPPAPKTPPPAAPAPSPAPGAGKQQSPKKDKPKS